MLDGEALFDLPGMLRYLYASTTNSNNNTNNVNSNTFSNNNDNNTNNNTNTNTNMNYTNTNMNNTTGVRVERLDQADIPARVTLQKITNKLIRQVNIQMSLCIKLYT